MTKLNKKKGKKYKIVFGLIVLWIKSSTRFGIFWLLLALIAGLLALLIFQHNLLVDIIVTTLFVIMLCISFIGIIKARRFSKLFYITSLLLNLGTLAILVFGIILAIAFDGYAPERVIPDPNSQEITEKRQKAYHQVATAFEAIDKSIPFKRYAISSHDQCHQGFKNYKTSDGYDNKCQYKATQYYGFNGDFRKNMTDLRDYLVQLKWKSEKDLVFPQPDAIDRVLVNYYDQHQHDNPSDTYRVCSLPMSDDWYFKDELSLSAEVTERDGCDTFMIDYFQTVSSHIDDFYNVKKFQDIKKLRDEIVQEYQYIIAIGIQQTYFEN